MAEPLSVIASVSSLLDHAEKLLKSKSIVPPSSTRERELTPYLALHGEVAKVAYTLKKFLDISSQNDANSKEDWSIIKRFIQVEDEALGEIAAHLTEASLLLDEKQQSQSRISRVFSSSKKHPRRQARRLEELILQIKRDADLLTTYLKLASAAADGESAHQRDYVHRRDWRGPRGEREYHDRDILDWLSPSEPSSIQDELRDRRLKSAATWLLEDKRYRHWQQASNQDSILWLPGIPGSGKTYLASYIIDDLQQKTRRIESNNVVYFYCDYRLREKLSTNYILASLLKQLVIGLPRVPRSLLDLYKSQRHTSDARTSFLRLRSDDVRTEFANAVTLYDSVYILIDALDECKSTERTNILKILTEFNSSVRVLITSRPEDDLQNYLGKYPKIVPSARDIDINIESYINTLVRQGPISAILDQDIKERDAREKARRDIVKGIYYKSGKLFLLARLHTQRLAKLASVAEIEGELAKVPSDLTGVYAEYLQLIQDQSSSYQMRGAKRILSWIFKAKRPLLIREIQQVLAAYPDKTGSDGTYHDERSLIDWCLGLITVDYERSVVRFVHFSVQEFLEQRQSFLDNDCVIANTCLTFLSLDDFAIGELPSLEAQEKLLREFPFLEYAAQYWAVHGKSCEEPEFKRLALEFVSSDKHLSCAAQIACYGGRSLDGSIRSLTRNVSGLHVVASFGLGWLASALLSRGVSVDAIDDQGQTPVVYAAKSGHTPLIELLASEGAQLDKKDNQHHRTPLSWATVKGHTEVVKWLLGRKSQIDINSFDYQHSTPLHIAFERHHYDIVDLLVSKGASLNLVDQWQRTQAQLAFSGTPPVDLSNYMKNKPHTKSISQGGQARVSVFKRQGLDQTSLDPYPFLFRKAFDTTGVEGAETLRLLVQERDYLRNLHHPNIVQFIAYEENDDHSKAYLWTEYCEEGDLSKFIRKDFGNNVIIEPQKHLDQQEVWSIFSDLAAAVSYLHLGVIKENSSFSLKTDWNAFLHRDIKPANVVISSQRNVPTYKLCDLGIAKIWDPAANQTKKGRGTSSWMPKEVKEQLKRWTVKGDIYSLGATMRDLAKDFEDRLLKSTIEQCIDDTPSKRPSCLTVLQIAREQLALLKQTEVPPFLPERPKHMDYIQQAIYELLERLFYSFRVIETSLRRHLNEKLEVLLLDAELRDVDCWGLKKSIMLMLVLGREKEAKDLITSGQGNWDCQWNAHGLTPTEIAAHDKLAIADLVSLNHDKQHRIQDERELMARMDLQARWSGP